MAETVNEMIAPDESISSLPQSCRANTPDGNTFPQMLEWKYRSLKIGSRQLPWLTSPPVQIVLIALVLFLGPAMFNALTGIGGSGQIDHRVADDANTALYSTFAVVSFIAGSFINVLGIRASAVLGALGYSVYMAAFLCYSYTRNSGFTVFAGALLGFCAALLWTAEGTILMSYPDEGSKGKYISVLWTIFNMGAVVGSLARLKNRLTEYTILISADSTEPKH